jgi:hypothetical protein
MNGKSLLQCLLAAALASLVLALPFMGSPPGTTSTHFFQVRLASSNGGMVQLFYDIGHGFNETDSARLDIEAGDRPVLLRFPLPPGEYRALRFDPLDRAATLTLGQARIVSTSGAVIRTFAPEAFTPANQIATLEVHGGDLTIVTTPGANDPNLRVAMSGPLKLEPPVTRELAAKARRFLPFLAVVGAAMFLLWLVPGALRARGAAAIAAAWRRLARRPRRTLALVGAAAVIVSCYPVVFLGRSFVSPNYGTHLLYDHFPTLPDSTAAHTADPRGADVGAIIWQQVPQSMFQHRAVFHDGQWPLWNRYNSGGVALYGQGQSMFGDPLHALVVLTDGAAWAWDLKYLIAKWLFAFGLGMIVWRLTRHLPSAALTGFAAAFIGFFVFRVNHPAFFSLCYAPWILYCWLRLVQAEALRPALGWVAGLLLANWAEMNSGTVKEAYMLLVGVNLSGAILLAAAARPWRFKLGRFAVVAAAAVVFALVSAPVWLTFLETLKQSYTSYDQTRVYQIQPGVILGLFDEIFYRPLQKQDRVFCPSANFLFLLGLLYLLVTLRRGGHDRLVLALAAAALVPLSLAFGLIPPDWILGVPFLANVEHVDNTFTCVLLIHLIPLAGVGLHAAWRRLGTAEGRGDAGMVLLLLGAMVFSYIAFGQVVHRQIYGDGETVTVWHWGEHLPVTPFIWGSLGALLIAAVVLLAVFRRMRARGTITLVTGFLAAACLGAMLWRQGMQADFRDNVYVLHTAPRADFHAKSPAVETVRADQSAPFRVVGFDDTLFAGWTGVYGLEGVAGPDALMNRHYRELLDACAFDREWDWRRVVHFSTLAVLKPVYDFLNIKYYFAPAGAPPPPAGLLTPVVQADLDVYRSDTCWPRAFFTDDVRTYDVPLQLAALIRQHPGQPFAAVQRGDPTAPAPRWRDPADRHVVPARDYRLTTNSTSFEVETPDAGVIVLQEPWLPDSFRVTVNGRPAKYFRVNHAFKGVAVPAAGTYRVRFTYRPPHWTLALLLAGAGLALLAGGAVAARRLPRPPPEP